MAGIRPFTPADVADVAALRQQSFARSAHATNDAAVAYFQEIFVNSPWADPELPSLVHEDAAGKVNGFIGRLARRVTFGGEVLRAAVPTQLSVASDAPPTVGVLLLKRLLGGPQDLTWSDVATDRVRDLWMRLSGDVVPIQSLYWTLPIRPSRAALAGVPGQLARAVRLASRVALRGADTIAATRAAEASKPVRAVEPLDLVELSKLRSAMSRGAVLSADSPDAIRVLLEHVARKQPQVPLRRVILRGAEGATLGWYVYFAPKGGMGDVVLLEARPGAYGAVVAHLEVDARAQGVEEVRGRMEPGLFAELGDTRCQLGRDGPWSLVQSNKPAVRDAILSGRTMLTRLDGEWWLNF